MTPFEINWLPGERIIYAKFNPSFDVREHTCQSADRLNLLLSQTDRAVPCILDMAELSITFGEMIAAMADFTRGDLPAWRHPNLKELILISEQNTVKIGAEALKQTQYGKVRATVFHSVSDALKFIHAKQRLITHLAARN